MTCRLRADCGHHCGCRSGRAVLPAGVLPLPLPTPCLQQLPVPPLNPDKQLLGSSGAPPKPEHPQPSPPLPATSPVRCRDKPEDLGFPAVEAVKVGEGVPGCKRWWELGLHGCLSPPLPSSAPAPSSPGVQGHTQLVRSVEALRHSERVEPRQPAHPRPPTCRPPCPLPPPLREPKPPPFPAHPPTAPPGPTRFPCRSPSRRPHPRRARRRSRRRPSPASGRRYSTTCSRTPSSGAWRSPTSSSMSCARQAWDSINKLDAGLLRGGV